MQSEPVEVSVPLEVRMLLGRAAVQVIAADAGADLLHIKGNAVDKALRPSDDRPTLLTLRAGGKALIYIPPHLGYGGVRAGNIPPFSGLIFEVEVLAVNPEPAAKP